MHRAMRLGSGLSVIRDRWGTMLVWCLHEACRLHSLIVFVLRGRRRREGVVLLLVGARSVRDLQLCAPQAAATHPEKGLSLERSRRELSSENVSFGDGNHTRCAVTELRNRCGGVESCVVWYIDYVLVVDVGAASPYPIPGLDVALDRLLPASFLFVLVPGGHSPPSSVHQPRIPRCSPHHLHAAVFPPSPSLLPPK